MAITVTERHETDRGSDGERKDTEKRYLVTGTATLVDALAALASNSPTTLNGLTRQTWNADPVFVDAGNPARSVWYGTVYYDQPASSAIVLDKGDQIIRSRSGGGTEHIMVPIARRGSYAPSGETAPEAHGIGDDGKGNVEGVDIHGWRYEFTVTRVYDNATGAGANDAPAETEIAALLNHTNEAEFTVVDTRNGRSITCQIDECILLGHECGGASRADGGFQIDYHFAVRPHQTDREIPNTGITVAEQRGWDYMWTRYEQAEDDTAHRAYAKALAAFVDQVYYQGDFSGLKLKSSL